GEDVVVLSVVDRGPGIPAAERDAVFERYHSGQDGGTGLGLSIARWIVELHGGQVLVHDASPGSRFEVILPMAREEIR
ncbi:MAG: HAMP domain-containing histidine kinase, partial [Acidimicrobiales bacterium]|nr:HAMP domain-containing histidine kinase [Acidimicrobiales bacterium]